MKTNHKNNKNNKIISNKQKNFIITTKNTTQI